MSTGPIDWEDTDTRSRRLRALPGTAARASAAVRDLVAAEGTQLVIDAQPDPAIPPPPWPLTRAEIDALALDGLRSVTVETPAMPNDPAARRWRAEFHRAEP